MLWRAPKQQRMLIVWHIEGCQGVQWQKSIFIGCWVGENRSERVPIHPKPETQLCWQFSPRQPLVVGDREDKDQSQRPEAGDECMESQRYEADGAATVPRDVSVLRQQWPALVPNVSPCLAMPYMDMCIRIVYGHCHASTRAQCPNPTELPPIPEPTHNIRSQTGPAGAKAALRLRLGQGGAWLGHGYVAVK